MMLKWRKQNDYEYFDTAGRYAILRPGHWRVLYSVVNGCVIDSLCHPSGFETCVRLADEMHYKNNPLAHLVDLVEDAQMD